MTDFLSIMWPTANRKLMQGRFTSLFVMLAILFCAIVMPATTYAQDIVASHSSEMFAMPEHADDADHEGSDQQTGDEPCHVVSHHHCSVALTVDAPSLTVALSLRNASLLPLTTASMSSFLLAPLTEPPAA